MYKIKNKDLKNYKFHKWTNSQIAKFWTYENNFPENFWGYNFGPSLIKMFKKQIKKSNYILDYGCGDGSLIKQILKYTNNYHKVYGFEYDTKTITNLRKKFFNEKNLYFFSNKNFPNKKFDIIFCTEVIEHLYDKELNNLLQTLNKFKSENGTIIFTTPNQENLEKSLIYNPINNTVFHRWQHVRNWSKDSLYHCLKKNKFNEIKFFETTLTNNSQNFIRNLYRKIKYKKINLIAQVN